MRACLIAGFLVIFMAPAFSQQVFKCINEGGQSQYSDRPCGASAKMLNQSTLRANTMDGAEGRALAARNRQEAYQSRPGGYAGQSGANCPSDLEIRNLETSASSVTASKEQRQMAARAVVEAMACKSGTQPPNFAAEPARIRPSPPLHPEKGVDFGARMKSCTQMGYGSRCSDSSGARYDVAPSGTITRTDGKRCYQRGNAVYCD